MKNLLNFVLFFVFLGFLFGCATTTLDDYQPKSTGEEEVLMFLRECDDAYQNRDMNKYSECFHEDAKIKVFDSPGTVFLVSKERFDQEYLKEGRGAFQEQKIINPKITAKENTANVSFSENSSTIAAIFYVNCKLIKENGKWYIMEYNW